MSIKKQIKIFNKWQRVIIGYERYRTRTVKDEVLVDVYTKSGGYIRLKKRVDNEIDLIEIYVGIINLYEGNSSAELYRQKVKPKSKE